MDEVKSVTLLPAFSNIDLLNSAVVLSSSTTRKLNSFLFSFLDYGWVNNNVPDYNLNTTYMGIGLGLAFETKAGIFNISYAVGKQGNNSLDFRQAKIHLGYANFF